jgi:hypothetical protein
LFIFGFWVLLAVIVGTAGATYDERARQMDLKQTYSGDNPFTMNPFMRAEP